ncbi:MAG: DISARM system helicase DrmA [Acidimicrobiales bacterium]
MTTATGSGAPVSSYEVRAELEALVERDLLGPRDGPTEELPPGDAPAERYLLGRLVPSSARPPTETTAGADPGDTDPDDGTELIADPDLADLETAGAAEEVEDPEPAAAVRTGRMAASAIGLSFAVPASVEVLTVSAEWGRYRPAPSQSHETEQGRPRTVWRREPMVGRRDVELGAEGQFSQTAVGGQDGVELRATVRHRGRRRIVDVSLVNSQPYPASTPDAARLYQVQLSVTAADGASPVFLGHNDPEFVDPPSGGDSERVELAMLYRRRRRYGFGRHCAVEADVEPGVIRAWRLRTTCFPLADVLLTVPAGAAATPGVVLDMARLGSQDLARDDLVRGLRPLVSGYRSWLQQSEAEAASDPEVTRYGPAASRLLDDARAVADRLDRAIDLLRDNPMAREAFRFANQAMALQRVRSEVVRRRLGDSTLDPGRLLAELDVAGRRSWRPFQLAFVLLCLPGLTDPQHPDAHRGWDDGQVQLLFFPTGGGKTESYLGLAAYTFAIRRLQGVLESPTGALDGTDGMAVLMRYTLRLLTAQQFQRAAALMCACEVLRRERIASGDSRWGAVPFRVGLWVGSKVSPNSFEEAQRQIEEGRDGSGAAGVLQLLACPWCGSRLGAADLRSDRERRRVLVFCSDPEGRCHFTARESPGEGIPVLTVDEEIYRLTPALVIATVDKLAQLPWKAATSTLFGLVEQRCDRHGWRNPDFDGFCKASHQATRTLPAVKSRPALRLRPPDLIIQDELHLISDALGSMVGLYETAVDSLCTRVSGEVQIRPVVVASTATVRRAADQVEKVFARGITLFPPQVLDVGETFFSTLVEPSSSTPSRRYRGIIAPGERLSAVEIRVVSSLMEHAQYLFDRHGAVADPYMTLVDYFSSTRELAGMRRLVDDDIGERIRGQRVRTRRRRPNVQELTSRMPSSRIAGALAELERPFDPTFDSTAAMDVLAADLKAGREAAAKRSDGLPIDVLLATSMLQVGVDVQRLGTMVVTGQPKNTAEYIQATSRIGRDVERPGVVFTIYQWSRPRDLAHYEDFVHYHETFGARVEGLTTTPFSDRALDRGLTGVLVTCLRHSSPSALPNPAAGKVDISPTAPAVGLLIASITNRAEKVLCDIPAADAVRQRLAHRLDSWAARRASVKSGVLGYETSNDVTGLLRKPEEGGWDTWTVPRSMREVEPEVLLQLRADDRSLETEGCPGRRGF